MTTNVYLYTFMYRDVTSDSNNIEVNYIIFVICNFDVFEVNSFFFFFEIDRAILLRQIFWSELLHNNLKIGNLEMLQF